MADNDTENQAAWQWTEQRERAALLVAQDRLSDQEIARALGVGKRTLERWKLVSEFRARVDEHLSAARDAIRTSGIADVKTRIERKQRDWERLQQIVRERAADPAMAGVPGGATGLLAVTVKVTKNGVIPEYRVDTGLLGALREMEEDAARELGQRVEKREVGGIAGGAPVQVVIDWADEEV